jgi:DNA-binding CsgD family transcriptional regulator
MSEIDIVSLIRAAYAAATQDELWPAWALDLIHKAGGSGGVFALVNKESMSLERPIGLWAPQRAIDEYLAGRHTDDPQLPIASKFSGSGMYHGLPGIDLDRDDTRDYLRWEKANADIEHTQTIVVDLGDGVVSAALSIHYSKGSDPTTLRLNDGVLSLIKSLEHAMRLGFRNAELIQDAFWDGIEISQAGRLAFLLDERARVLRLTDAAACVIAQRDGFDITAGYLTPVRVEDQEVLRSIIARAIHSDVPGSSSMRVGRRAGLPPFILTAYPIERSVRLLAPAEAAVLVTLVNPVSKSSHSSRLYREAFRLTVREAEFATLLAKGESIETAASNLNMATPTARTHMRRIYQKTGTSGQIALVRLLASLK